MADPTTVAAPRTDWLTTTTSTGSGWTARKSKGLTEGPQVFEHDGRVNLLFSAGASWLPSYCIGRLELRGPDPLDPEAWHKYPQPAFVGTSNHSGVGHATTVRSPDGTQHWLVYHSKVDSSPGWQRRVSIQPFSWHRGRPVFGTVMDEVPVPAGNARPRTPRRTWNSPGPPPTCTSSATPAHRLLAGRDDPRAGSAGPGQPVPVRGKVLLTDPAPGTSHRGGDRLPPTTSATSGSLFRVSRPTPQIRLPTRILRGDHHRGPAPADRPHRRDELARTGLDGSAITIGRRPLPPRSHSGTAHNCQPAWAAWPFRPMTTCSPQGRSA